MRSMLTKISWLYVAALLLWVLSSCTSTRTTAPNHSHQGPYPDAYKNLKLRNSLLTAELGKLPELQDGISDAETFALSQILDFYNQHPRAFDNAFKKMYQVGSPASRKYCSPLQAVFWLAQDANLHQAQLSIRFYNLAALLDHAWLHEFNSITNEDLKRVIREIDEDVREEYVRLYNNVGKMTFWKVICADYKKSPQLFSAAAAKMINEVNSRGDSYRWADFEQVVDRLNAPELLDYYINHRIVYDSVRRRAIGRKAVFEFKHGDCDDLVVFGNYALKRAGYKTIGRQVHNDFSGHAGLAIELKDGRYMLVVNYGTRGNRISGPYQNVNQVDEALGYGKYFDKKSSFRLGLY
jgi:hypothetical protein